MPEELRQLLNAPDDELFTKGACHIYAIELKQRCPESKIKQAGIRHVGLPIGTIRVSPRHAYGAFGDCKIDVRGVVNEAEYLKSEDYVAREVSEDELMTMDSTKSSVNGPLNQWRHYLHAEFVARASERARRHIEGKVEEWRSVLGIQV
jgi:hypothetical protein